MRVTNKMKKLTNVYDDTMSFLLGAIDYEKVSKYKYDSSSFNLDRMDKLLKIAGNPHHDLKTIHVAGTKGKGSTSNMIASILMETGLKVGLFTSPHLINLEERIKINNRDISKEDLCAVTDVMRPYIESEREKELYMSPTFFEALTAIALLYFKNEEVDVAVLEVGLGGRLDSTNIVTPLVSVITSIGFDHTDKLGTTLDLIAGEKAGIIKENVPVISSPQENAALGVIEETCIKMNSQLVLVGRDIKIENLRKNIDIQTTDENRTDMNNKFGSTCDLLSVNNNYRGISIPVPGVHQTINCAGAIGAVEAAAGSFSDPVKSQLSGDKGVETVRNAIRKVECPGRIEVVLFQDHRFVIDRAHTVESIRALKETVNSYIKPGKITLLIGIAEDKDVNTILNELVTFADSVIFTITGNPRAAAPDDLAHYWHSIKPDSDNGNNCYSFTDIMDSFEFAMKITDKSDLICVTGSTYLAGEVKALMEG